MVRIIAAGHVNWDVTLRVASLPAPDGEAQITSQHRSGGGSAANVASALAGFDVPVGLIGSVGDDEHGFLARRELELDGVDLTGLRVVEDAATTVKYLVVDEAGEVMVLANEGANEAIGPADVDDAYVRRATHLHLTSQRPATAERLVDLAAAGDSTVSFDPGRRIDERDYGDLFDRVDILFLNDREAVEALPRDTEDPSELVQATGRVLVVKHGAAGATVFTPSGTYDHPGFGVDQVDTTGAGDAFAAGFLAVLVGGLDLDGTADADGEDLGGTADPDGEDLGGTADADGDYGRALEVANACGALAACEEGARTAPDLERLRRFLDEQFRAAE